MMWLDAAIGMGAVGCCVLVLLLTAWFLLEWMD